MAIEIHIAASRKEMELFCSFPNVLYKGNPYYVPTLEADDFKTFDRKQNAAFEFCQAEYFLAYKENLSDAARQSSTHARTKLGNAGRSASAGLISSMIPKCPQPS